LDDSSPLQKRSNMSTTTTEEPTTCSCGRPAVYDPFSGETRYCAEHKRAVFADGIYVDWLQAHETMRERLGEVLDSEDDAPLNEVLRGAMNRIKRECARWAGELEIAGLMAEDRPEGFSVEGVPITVEKAEEGERLLKRADRLEDAIEAVYQAPGLDESERWAILAVLYEVNDEASEELSRFRGGLPA
jgi:hypothetical protein